MTRNVRKTSKNLRIQNILALRQGGASVGDIAKQLKISVRAVSRAMSSSAYQEAERELTEDLATVLREVTLSSVKLQRRIIKIVDHLLDRIGDTDDVDTLLKTLNILSRFCNVTIQGGVNGHHDQNPTR